MLALGDFQEGVLVLHGTIGPAASHHQAVANRDEELTSASLHLSRQ